MMVGRGNRTPFKHFLKLWFQILIHTPNHFKEAFRHGELVTTFQRIGPVLPSGGRYLTLGGKPEMHPEWEIDEDDSVCHCESSLDAGPRTPTIYNPSLICCYRVEFSSNYIFVCLYPTWKPLDLIN